MPATDPHLRRLHVIGICGVATSALAIAFHKAGVNVTGSDKGFFPPVSVELEKAGVSFYAGWHPEKMVAEGDPDLVVVTTASGTHNPETLFAKERGLKCMGYTDVFEKYFIRTNSIVCAGTWGKTSSSALLSHILIEAGVDPSYMFGGISLSHEAAARISDSDWSVFEGDEYKSSPTDPRAKFFHYKPTHLLLTAVSWDHADLYPTEAEYFNAFRKLIATIPATGLIVVNKDNAGTREVMDGSENTPVTYGVSRDCDYTYMNVRQSVSGLEFEISHGAGTFTITSPLLGRFQAENITGCFAMAHSIGIEPLKIIAAIASFKGMKRRLEKRLDGEDGANGSGVTVFDDIAHSPEKASAVLEELREIYGGTIIAVFEPNIGGRERDAAGKYDGAFKHADIVIIPRLTKLKVSNDPHKVPPMEGQHLAEIIGASHSNVRYIDSDEELVGFLSNNAKKGGVIAFLGSHGFRGMIEETITSLRQRSPSQRELR